MACVTVTNVTVLDNPARFENPFQVTTATSASRQHHAHAPRGLQHSAPPPPPSTLSPPILAADPTACRRVPPAQFEIEFECIAPIPDDIEWKLTCGAASLHPCTPVPLASLHTLASLASLHTLPGRPAHPGLPGLPAYPAHPAFRAAPRQHYHPHCQRAPGVAYLPQPCPNPCPNPALTLTSPCPGTWARPSRTTTTSCSTLLT